MSIFSPIFLSFWNICKIDKKIDQKAYNILFFSLKDNRLFYGVPRMLKSVLLPERST